MSAGRRLLAVVPVRSGELPAGAIEAIGVAGGRCLLVGDGVATAARETAGVSAEVWVWEAGAYRPCAWAQALAGLLATEAVVVLPGSPDGRDLAPRLSHGLRRSLVSGAVAVNADIAVVARADGRVEQDVELSGDVVVVLQPGTSGVEVGTQPVPPLHHVDIDVPPSPDPDLEELIPADPATIDLSESDRIVAGGAGLGEPDNLELLGRVGSVIGASLGATRVLTDAGWIAHERQIGTTGVEIDPDLYVAIGISGAVQHLMGIGDPPHVIAVNLDPSCPMMARADLAVVSDGRGVVAELGRRLGVTS